MLTPNVRGNAGCYRAVHRDGAGAHRCSTAMRPASVSHRQRNGWYVAPNVLNALAPGAPAATAGVHRTAVSSACTASDRSGRVLSDMTLHRAAAGRLRQAATASPACSGRPRPRTRSVEMFEKPDAGAGAREDLRRRHRRPGAFRGGLGERVACASSPTTACETLAAVYPEGVDVPQRACSADWRRDRVRTVLDRWTVDRATGQMVTLTSTAHRIETRSPAARATASRIGVPRAGRGGHREGYVTREGAARDYGYTKRLPGAAPRVPVAAEPA